MLRHGFQRISSLPTATAAESVYRVKRLYYTTDLLRPNYANASTVGANASREKCMR